MDFEPLSHQAAGHPGPMQSLDGSLFLKETTSQEVGFYEHMAGQLDEHELGSRLVDWMPTFMGTLALGATDEAARHAEESVLRQAEKQPKDDRRYLVLRNALYGYSKPSVMDIKLGSVLYDSNAAPEKVERLRKVSESTTSGSLGFRICGMKISHDKKPDCEHVSMEDGVVSFDKLYGRSLNKDTVKEGIELFFRHNDLSVRAQNQLLERFLVRLQLLYNCLLDEKVEIRSGSLLFVYETDPRRWDARDYEDPIIDEELVEDEDEEEDEEEERVAPLSALKVIDFAHSRPASSYDENVISGVDSLIRIFECLI